MSNNQYFVMMIIIEVTIMDRRELIIKNALTDFNEKGCYASSISEIAKMSGISKATFFHYFKNKEELINEVFLHCKRVFLKNSFRTIRLSELSDEEIIQYLTYNYEHKEELTFINNNEYSSYVSEEVKQQGANMHHLAHEEITKAQANHEIIDLDPTFLYMFMTNTIISNLDKMFKDGEIDIVYTKKIISFISKAIEL